jgi:hypothetical protein
MCSQVLDGLKMVFPKSNANLVINITCVLLYLSRAIFIFECLTLVYKIYIWVSYCRPWFVWPENKKLVIPFLCIYLIASLFPCIVYPHIGDLTNLVRYPPLKPNIIFCDYLLDHNLSLRMDHQLKEDRKTVLTMKNSSISPKEKYFRYLPYLYHLFARGQAKV